MLMKKIIIADDHAIVRKGLQLIFNATPDLEVVDEACNGNNLLKKIQTKHYDVVILDLFMPGKDGLDVLKEIKCEKPHLPVVILSMQPGEEYALRLLKNGASAFLNKEASHEDIISAIRIVASGKKYYTTNQAEQFLNSIQLSSKESQVKPHERLSDREFQVMCMLAAGNKKQSIAGRLFISVNTINNHRNNILRKMDLKSNYDLARYAVINKLIK
jgi:two-component system, NarL family, invasion response regulator UvrY